MPTSKGINSKLAVRRCILDLAEDISLSESLRRFSNAVSVTSRETLSVRYLVFEELQKLRRQLKEELTSAKSSANGDVHGLLSLLAPEDRKSVLQQIMKERSAASTSGTAQSSNRNEDSSRYASSRSQPDYKNGRARSETDIERSQVPFSIPKLDALELEDLKGEGMCEMNPKLSFRNEVIQVVAIPTVAQGLSSEDSSDRQSLSDSVHSDVEEDVTSPEMEKFTRMMTSEFMNDPQFVRQFKRGDVNLNDAIIQRIRTLMNGFTEKKSTVKLSVIHSAPVKPDASNKVDKSVQIDETPELLTDMATSSHGVPNVCSMMASLDEDISSSIQSSNLSAGQVELKKATMSIRPIVSCRTDGSVVASSSKPQVYDTDCAVYYPDVAPQKTKSPRVANYWRPASRTLRIEEAELSTSAHDTVSARGIRNSRAVSLSAAFHDLDTSGSSKSPLSSSSSSSSQRSSAAVLSHTLTHSPPSEKGMTPFITQSSPK